jgi:hypothetical protein
MGDRWLLEKAGLARLFLPHQLAEVLTMAPDYSQGKIYMLIHRGRDSSQP